MLFNSRKLLNFAASTALAAGLIATAMPAQANVVFDNLPAVQDITDTVFSDGPLAQSFNSGTGGALDDVQLLLTNSTTQFAGGSLQISLVADSSTSPGAKIISLGTLLNGAVPTSSTKIFDFAPVSSTLLAANTTYWIEISETAPNGIEWSGSDDLSGIGVANSFFFDADNGVNPASAFGAFQMAVAVPEPGTAALFMSGLLGLGLIFRRSRI
jgi:hypothetical protein